MHASFPFPLQFQCRADWGATRTHFHATGKIRHVPSLPFARQLRISHRGVPLRRKKEQGGCRDCFRKECMM
jgi:hypothetical protein